jgi:WS/DGAT/MGAT family acyltransferase
MRQLAGGDDIWFAIETENTPMHILSVAIYDPATGEAGSFELDDVKAFLQERLGGLPLRRRLLSVPWNADFPYWIEDENFDLDRHLHHIPVEPPGDWPALLATVGRIMEVPLDRSRPLWDLYLITGLGEIEGAPPGCFALATKLHHGQFDGTNLMRLMRRLQATEPTPPPPPPDDWSPERTPSGFELLMRAPWNRTRRLVKGARVLRENVPKWIQALAPQDRGEASSEKSRPVAKTRFARSLGTRERVFDGLVLPLKDVMALRHRVEGATVNDVALAICTGALRRYLQAHGELPEDPLVISAPVSAHEEGESEDAGNRISVMFVTLPTNVADPLERLRRVREATSRSKTTSRELGAGNVADVLDTIPTYLLGPAFEQIVRFGLAEYLPQPACGVSITNVPGPRKPGYFRGARCVRALGCAFLFDGVGLIIAISSYCDDFLVQFTSTPTMMPDPAFFTECLREAYSELAAAG